MEREVAAALTSVLAGDPALLAIAAVLDFVIGDPTYRAHPVRLIGRTLSSAESALRGVGMNGYAGGVVLFVVLVLVWGVGWTAVVVAISTVSRPIGWMLHLFLLYSLLALGDLVRHVWRVEKALAQGNLAAARQAIALLVGRDTDVMDAAACRRAAIESLSENLTDGFVSPVLWYVAGGLGGLLLFKIVSTMDSMVGYQTPQYRRFGWLGARLDDVMNYIPARLTWLLIAAVAWLFPRYSGRKALSVGFMQHGVIPGPNPGWSEAAVAGALERRLVGPIWRGGRAVTNIWIGEPTDPPAESHDDVRRAIVLVATAGAVAVALSCAAVAAIR
jgi:adenosylcobinamide-phosphate synthase